MRWQEKHPQVWALDTRSGELLYLEEGDAEKHRAAARDGLIHCPSPQCPAPRFGVRSSPMPRLVVDVS